MRRKNWIGMIAVATTCALVGAAGGIATSGAATATTATPAAKAKAKAKAAKSATTSANRPAFAGPGHGFSVHSVSQQLNKAGTAFIEVTRDEGTVTAVSGSTITLHEGTATVAYKDVTVTVPDGATVTRNDATATLADIKVGDRVEISSSSEATVVRASDPSFRPAGGRGHHGPGGRGDGPPPGAPGTDDSGSSSSSGTTTG
jgi:hypothetical protein